MLRTIRRWLTAGFFIYLAGGLILYFFQEKFLFQAKKLPMDHKYDFPGPYNEINLPVNNKKTIGIVQFTVPDTACKGVVLYYHGNKKNIERYASYAPYFTKNNYEVWMMDYPGYGKSTGERSEKILYEDALQLYKMARARFSEDSIIIYGKSLGTGIASQLASIRNCKRLILETPYFDCPSVIRQYLPFYPVQWLMNYQFPIHEYLLTVSAPVTIFQGTKDRIITYSNSRKLLPYMKKEDDFITIKGGSHNDIFEFQEARQKLDSLLSL